LATQGRLNAGDYSRWFQFVNLSPNAELTAGMTWVAVSSALWSGGDGHCA
jgi:hypothetical protein